MICIFWSWQLKFQPDFSTHELFSSVFSFLLPHSKNTYKPKLSPSRLQQYLSIDSNHGLGPWRRQISGLTGTVSGELKRTACSSCQSRASTLDYSKIGTMPPPGVRSFDPAILSCMAMHHQITLRSACKMVTYKVLSVRNFSRYRNVYISINSV